MEIDQGKLTVRAMRLACAAIIWNAVEAVVAIVAGFDANSTALVGFGLDSIVEGFSSAVILWHLRGNVERNERRTLRLIAVSFYALAAYVAVGAIVSLAGQSEPAASSIGITLAALSLAIMPALTIAKRRTGVQMGSSAVVADSNQSKLCTYLSVVLLGGLVLNATIGWWWADPLAALIIAAMAISEGREAWRGDSCACG